MGGGTPREVGGAGGVVGGGTPREVGSGGAGEQRGEAGGDALGHDQAAGTVEVGAHPGRVDAQAGEQGAGPGGGRADEP